MVPAVVAAEIVEGYVRGMPPGQSNSAAFLRIDNAGGGDWHLVSGRTDVADSVELHSHQRDQGVVAMRRVSEVLVPAGGSFAFKPGGYHVMLIGLQRSLREGELVGLTLCADSGECISAELPVRSVLNEHHHQHH